MALTAREKLSRMIAVVAHIKVRRAGPYRVTRSVDPLSFLLTDSDCDALLGQLAARATELGLSTQALLDDMLSFLLALPRDIDDLRLEAEMIRMFDLFAFSVAPPDEVDGRIECRTQKAVRPERAQRPRWRMSDGSGLADRRGDYITLAQAREAYEPATIALQAYGTPYNAYYTMVHGPLGLGSDKKAAEWQSKLLSRLRGKFYEKRAERMGPAHDLHRFTFNARASDGSLETTTIFNLPKEIEGGVETWLRKFVAAKEQTSGTALAFNVEHPVGVGRYARHWALQRRFWGGLDPDLAIGGVRVLDLLKIPQHLRRRPGKIDCRRFNPSQSISEMQLAEAERLQLPFLSAWGDRAWQDLFTGWELKEHKDRMRELTRRQEREDMLRRTYRENEPLEAATLRAALAKERASWPVHAHDRERSWGGWWTGDAEA